MFGLEDPYLIIVNVAIVVVCTLLAGVASGLNLAFFSLDFTNVTSLAMGTNEVQARRAKRILVVLQHTHWLLVTLLLMNAVAAESLPLALDELMGPEVAIPVSVIIVLFFGEIIPQSIFVSNAIAVCGFFAYLVYGFMIITAPITLPLGILLDKLVGHRSAKFYRRRELREFINLQSQAFFQEGDHAENGFDDEVGGLGQQEITLMMGALSLSETTVGSALKTRIEDTMCLRMNERVTKELVERVFLSGKSRIPVYEDCPAKCTHYFLSKMLILQTYKKEEDAPLVRDLHLMPAHFIESDKFMGDAYQILTAHPVHLLLVREPNTETTIGMMTISDVLESIHHARFIDESDLTNQKPMQMLIKSCWDDKRDARASFRKSRLDITSPSSPPGMLQRSASHSYLYHTNNNSFMPNAARLSIGRNDRQRMSSRKASERDRLAIPSESVNRSSYGGAAARLSSGSYTPVEK